MTGQCVHPDLRVKFSRHKNGPVEKYRHRHREQAFPGKVSGSAGFFCFMLILY